MGIKLSLLLFLFLPLSIFAQTLSDTAPDSTVKADCDDKKFTRTEILPSLKISKQAFIDSLMSYLESKNVIIENKVVPFKFFLTSRSNIVELSVAGWKTSLEFMALKSAMLHFSNLWKPAVQNSYIVCAYVSVIMEFHAGKIESLIIWQ